MTGSFEEPPGPEGADATRSSRQPDFGDGPPHGVRVVRAALVLVVAVVLGILLLPSATRSPRTVSSPSASTTTTTVPPTTSTTHPATTTTLPGIAHSVIKVLVANGTNTAHGASEVRSWLGGRGFDVAPFPAYDTTTPETADAIYYVGSGTVAMATEVAQALSLGSAQVQPAGQTPPVATTSGADVVVVLGTDLATRADAGTLGHAPS